MSQGVGLHYIEIGLRHNYIGLGWQRIVARRSCTTIQKSRGSGKLVFSEANHQRFSQVLQLARRLNFFNPITNRRKYIFEKYAITTNASAELINHPSVIFNFVFP